MNSPKSTKLVKTSTDNYSGQVVRERDLKRYQSILRALHDGLGVDRIAKIFGASVHTVLAIRKAHPELPGWRAAASKRLGRFIERGLDRLNDEADKVPIGQLTTSVAIAVDKKLLLDGEVQATPQSSGSDLDKVVASLRQLRSQAPVAVNVMVNTTAQERSSVRELHSPE